MDRSGVVGSRWCSAVAAETTVGKAGLRQRLLRLVLTSGSMSAAMSGFDIDESSLWEVMESVRERKVVMRTGGLVCRA